MYKIFLIATALVIAMSGSVLAQEKPVLTVYTYDSFAADWGPGPQIKKAFEKTCDCEVTFVAAGDGAALLARLQLEGHRSKADVVVGLDTNLIAQAREGNHFIAHSSFVDFDDLPYEWHDQMFLPYDWGYFAFIYDKTRTTEPPLSFEELINRPDDFKIIIQDPRSSSPGLGLLLWVKHIYGDRAPEIWRALAPHILTVTKGWSEAYGMFLSGEADMVLSYTTSPAYHLIAEEDDTKAAAVFEQGHYMQIEVAAMRANSEELSLAGEFLQFLVSPEVQKIIPTTNWMYPVQIPEEGLPVGFESLVSPKKSLMFSPEEAQAVKEEALAEWLAALSK